MRQRIKNCYTSKNIQELRKDKQKKTRKMTEKESVWNYKMIHRMKSGSHRKRIEEVGKSRPTTNQTMKELETKADEEI